ncbi:hypothetical protein CP556_20395 [Natrinema sp. CBA1119]|uniref:hypothetical protein n=1 Tax=unclassified Natrinema TaxID=2622230 RepID=UPI000BF815BD|nr:MULTISPECIES: hypothetical protein [unclassified Natrinema]MDS0478391.1 hypothetical protein [Natrinema sp. 1APR25-10V2]PGF14481.1 hypothetical protein CP556_20395 [Natrinema sp. CBA1119]
MGVLEQMLGKTEPGEQGIKEQSYTLPKETHGFVYPVAVRRDEVETFAELVEAEADASPLADTSDDLQSVFDGMVGEGEIDTEELAEQLSSPRQAVEPIIDTWQDAVDQDIGVVYARVGAYENLLAFVKFCKQRDEDVDDPFKLPETFSKAAALLKRLEEGTDTRYRALVHTDLLPDQ